MADTAQNPYLPFAQEFNLIDQFRGGKQITAPTVSGAGVPLMSGQQLQQLMTSYLRGPGNFLEKSRAQNMAGLYNSSTNRLMQDNALAEASRQATEANVKIQLGNQQLAQGAQAANKDLQLRAMLHNASQPRKRTATDVALAALMQGFQSKYGGGKREGGTSGKDAKYDPPAVEKLWDKVSSYFSGSEAPSETMGVYEPGPAIPALGSQFSGYTAGNIEELIQPSQAIMDSFQTRSVPGGVVYDTYSDEFAGPLQDWNAYQSQEFSGPVQSYYPDQEFVGPLPDWNWTSGTDAGGTYQRSEDEDFVWE